MEAGETVFTRQGVRRGIGKMLALSLFVVPFGMAFGVAAVENGMDGWVAIVMSVSNFAGASQFAVLELWSAEVPLVPLILITFAVNARHLLMGAALAHWIRPIGWPKTLLTASVTTDPNFALITAERMKGERDAGLLLGAGLTLWTAWSIGTLLGVGLGSGIGDPRAIGIDVLLPAFFMALLIGLWRGRRSAVPWLVAGLVAVLANLFIPGHWHIVIGALAGGLVGAFSRGV